MSNYKTALIAAVMGLLGVLVMGSLSPSGAQVVVDCNNGDVLQDAIDAAPTNETILITGTCNENVRIDSSKQGLTIDGQGSARIVAADDNMATVSIFGRGITIQNFRVIRGGSNGIRLSDSASATITNNRIIEASGQGIRVEGNSFATIIGNIVRRHGVNGISILESSSAEIGTNCTEEALNIIARNGQSGIALSRNAQASIRGNIIRNNTANGIFVSESSMADTASNVITGNGGDGIDVRLGSIVRMGRRNAPDSCRNNPNTTNPNNLNAGIGIDCQNLSTVDGVLGSLDGTNGAADLKDDNSDCPDCCFAFVDLEPTPPPSDDVVQVFITGQSFIPTNFGGLAGADAKCQERAETAGLTGTWTAWLSDSTGNAVDRIPDGEYQLLDGTIIADDKADLTFGRLKAPINVNERGEPLNGIAWTGTSPDGTDTGTNCSDWTDAGSVGGGCTAGHSSCGDRGSGLEINSDWTQITPSPTACNQAFHLYCFGGGQ